MSAFFNDCVSDFAAALAATGDRDERRALFSRAVGALGVSHFAYLNTATRLAPWYLETTYPEAWIERYIQQGYVEVDVVPAQGRRSPLPFRWRPLLDHPGTPARAHTVFDEAAEFGIHDGMSVPIHRADGFSLMSMAVADPALLAPKAAAERHRIQLMSLYYHDAVERAAPAGGPARTDPPVRLTPREREVLLWASRGKTGWEIAQILHVAERTVVFHAENAKAKLGASSRSQAVVRAITLGLLAP